MITVLSAHLSALPVLRRKAVRKGGDLLSAHPYTLGCAESKKPFRCNPRGEPFARLTLPVRVHTHEHKETNEVSTTPRMIPTVLTWDDLVRAEPRLAVLRAEVEQITAGDGQRFCANEHWYGYNGQPGIKRELVRLVGFRAENPDPVLHSIAAYDATYQELYALLPDCWDCDCAPRWVA